MRALNNLLVVMLPLWMAAILCCTSDRKAKLTVSAKDNRGQALANAQVIVDGQHIGKTNTSGTFTGSMVIGHHREMLVQLEGPSTSEKSFAPHVVKLEVSPAQDIKVDGVLYEIPSWSFEKDKQDLTRELKPHDAAKVTADSHIAPEKSAASKKTKNKAVPQLVKQDSPPIKKRVEKSRKDILAPKLDRLIRMKLTKKADSLNILKKLDAYIANGQINLAQRVVDHTPKKHPHYRKAHLRMAELLLEEIYRPQKAMEYYQTAKVPFSHPGLNTAKLYVASELDKAQRQLALSLLREATQGFDKHISSTAKPSAQLIYKRALSWQRLYELSKDKKLIVQVRSAWQMFVKIGRTEPFVRQKLPRARAFLASTESELVNR